MALKATFSLVRILLLKSLPTIPALSNKLWSLAAWREHYVLSPGGSHLDELRHLLLTRN